MNERLTIISNAIYDDEFINLVRPNYQNYLDGQSKIPYYIHAGGDYEYVGFTDYSVNKLEKTLDSSFYKEFIVNIFNRIDNLIDIDFELWGHNNGSLIDIYAIEYVPNDPVIGTAYLWDGWVDIEFRVLDDVRENYITIVHEIGHALGLDHPNGNGFNSNYDIQDTIMSYNDNPSLEDIWFSDADIYTLQRIYGLEEDNNNNGSASFSISGTAAVGNTLSISEDSADPDGTGTLNYAWQTSSDVSNWNVTGTNSTYIVGASEEGKSIRAVLSYMDAQGFNEVVTTPASSIPFVDDGSASFSISGTAAVGNTLSISEDSVDPDGTGTLNYAWQTSSDGSNWNVAGTNSTYIVGASEEGKSIRAVLSYMDAQGFNEVVNTSTSSIPFVDDGSASFSISGTAAVGNTLSISEDSVDPDGTGTLSYAWQTSSDGSNWNVAGTNSTYIVGASEEGKSIRAVLSYMDAQGFNEVVNTSTSSIPFVDDGSASFSISGTAAVGNTLSISEDSVDPDGTGTLSYIWQTSSDGNNWNVAGTNSTYIVGASEEGKSIRSVLSYMDAQGFNEVVTTPASSIPFVDDGSVSFSISETAAIEKTAIAKTLTDFEALNYIASYGDLINAFGIDLTSAKTHYTNYGISEGRSLTAFSATNYLAKYSDLSAAFGNDQTLALKHYIEFGYSEGRTDSGSGSSSNLTDFEALNYIASYGDLINVFGTDLISAKSHYTNYGISEGRSLTSFSATDYLAKYSDLSASFGSDQTLALKHYIEYGFSEGRIDTSSSSVSGAGSGESSNLTDFEALNYIASYGDLINAFGTDLTSAKFHYTYYGKSKGLTLDDFDEWGYLASNNDLINSLGSDTTEAVKHYISFGYSQGKITNSFDAQSYLNNYADLRNAFGDNQELATKHYVEYGFNEGRIV